MRCVGNQTYNEDLTDNGFIRDIIGQHSEWVHIVKVIKGRGFLGKPPNKPAVGYYDEPYGNETFHLPGDTVRLGCRLGSVNGVGKPFVGATCTCDNSTCDFVLANSEFGCVPEAVQQMPVWTGGVFNFVKAVHPKYVTLKARVANLLSIAEWPFDSVDPNMHPDWLDEEYWKTADFTLFVFCPFDVTLGGTKRGGGKMTFPDFYPGEHSDDGMLWSFYSREGTRVYKPKKCFLDEETEQVKCVWRSSYFKGFIDRSTNKNETGPIEYNTDFETEVDYSCETGILDGHHYNAVAKLRENFRFFMKDFRGMANYLRNPPFDLDQI